MSKTLEQGFDTFIGWISPLTSEHEKAKKHKDSVKSSLENNFKCYDFFETGSFGNGTSIRHYSDTDYFGVCPSKELWENSAYTLRKVKEALQTTFWQTKGIEVKNPAVQIPLGSYASERLEVTPCTFNGLVNTPEGMKSSYDIANFNDGWMKASPQAHNAYVKRVNDRLSGKLKPLIQLVKAWKFYNNIPITSFYLELRVTKYAEGKKSIDYDIDLKRVIKHLHDIQLSSIVDPMGISGYVQACSTDTKKHEALSKLNTGYSRAEKAHEQRDKNLETCFYWWNLFFNNKFPAR
jgi:hypothetical protein